MLNFDDFTDPLGEGRNIGEAFQEWFDAQAPYVRWEQEWYYGMVVCGDPTLVIHPETKVRLLRPERAIYINNNMIMPFFIPIVIGKIDVIAGALDADGIDRVEFYVDDELVSTDTTEPYMWTWGGFKPGLKLRHTVKTMAYDTKENHLSDEIIVWKLF
jgi:hypothetical protein